VEAVRIPIHPLMCILDTDLETSNGLHLYYLIGLVTIDRAIV
jgi:hypothetical protein